jgi:hypothetical protein
MQGSRQLRYRRAVVVGAIAAAGVGLSGYHVAAAGDDRDANERDGDDESDRDADGRPDDGPGDDRELPPAMHERLCRCPSCMGGLGAPGE